MNLLRPFTGTGAIFFPIGLPPSGTCEFSTENCRKHCYVLSNNLFDYESNISVERMLKVYNYIMNESVYDVCCRIAVELNGLQTPILHWFGSGDCLDSDIDKISLIIDVVPDRIIQMGFTRNIKLWERYKNIFALTIEKKEDAIGEEGIFSIPSYAEEISVMYSPRYDVRGGHCGPITCKDIIDGKLEHHINCRVCHDIKIGCFDRR